MGYSESLKAYRIYFPGFKKIYISRDVTFDEDTTYNKSRKIPVEEPEETEAEAPRTHDTTMNEEAQEEDREFEETFAPVARYTSIKSILALATVMKWKIHQMDVKTAFLNGVVEEEVYVEQPLGFETHRLMCVN